MAGFPIPANRPAFIGLKPVQTIGPATELVPFTHVGFMSLPVLYVYTCALQDVPTPRSIYIRFLFHVVSLFSVDCREPRHFPQRTLWCGPDAVHAIVYNPTHEFWSNSKRWVTPSTLSFLSGDVVDLFINIKNCVYYAGIYALHSMRDVHPPGSPIPHDVVSLAAHPAR
jgi:hypothetical protein